MEFTHRMRRSSESEMGRACRLGTITAVVAPHPHSGAIGRSGRRGLATANPGVGEAQQ
jgi:hypothetical protein